MRFTVLQLLVASISLASCAHAADASVPRMWKIDGPRGERMFILGISHHGSTLENDAYFHDIVVPIFRKADVLHFEDGGGGFANQQIECSAPLADPEGKQVVKRAREIVQRDAVEYFRRILKDLPEGLPSKATLEEDARIFAEGLSEFSLVTTLKHQYEFLVPQGYVSVEVLGGGPVVDELRGLRPDLPTQSMDEPDDMALAYCASAVRRELLSEQIDRYNLERPLPQASKAEAVPKVDESIHNLFIEHRTSPSFFYDAFVCSRNEMWMDRLSVMGDGQNHFLALGVAHLFPYRGTSRQCEGLLSDLRRAGYRVSPVDQVDEDAAPAAQ